MNMERAASPEPPPQELIFNQFKSLFRRLKDMGALQAGNPLDLPREQFEELLAQAAGKVHGKAWAESARHPDFVGWVSQRLQDEAKTEGMRAAREAARAGISPEKPQRRAAELTPAMREAYLKYLARFDELAAEAQTLGFKLIPRGNQRLNAPSREETLYIAGDAGGKAGREELEGLTAQDLYDVREEVMAAEKALQEYRRRRAA